MKVIEVTISQTLSSTQEIELPDNVDEKDPWILKQAVLDQIVLPSDALEYNGYASKWIIDDFCVV